MASRILSKSLKSKRPHEDSDKEWTPSNGNMSPDSQTSSPIKLKMESSDVKSGAFQRVWSEEEEIAILQGHLNYSSLKSANPSSDYAAFLTFVKDDLQAEASKTQLQDKLGRLRRKYRRNLDKRKFSKPHEEKLFKLSKKIWGQVDNVKGKVDDKVVHTNREKMIVAAGSSGICSNDLVLSGGSATDLENWFRRNPRQLISEKDRNKMLEKSQSIKIAKAQQYLSEIEVMEEQAKVAIDALQAVLP